MVILYLISSLNYGGAEKQTVLDANMMIKENKVFLGYFNNGPLMDMLDDRVNIIKLRKSNYFRIAIFLARLVRQNHIKIIHSSLYRSMIISAFVSLICDIKVIWHFHSHEYELPWVHRMTYKILARIDGIKKICFVSKELIQYYQEKGFNFPLYKIEVIYNNSTLQYLSENKKKNEKIIIGFVGRLVPLKRVEYLIGLTQYLVNNQVMNFKIIIVGDGPQRFLLEQESLNKGLQEYISFVGFQNHIESYYTDIDVFVNPSQEECLSISLIDAGISGIPSVAFRVGGNHEIIIDSQTGYLVTTKDDFFEKVFRLVLDNTLREEMGLEASKYCQTNFSKEVHLQALMSLYSKALAC